MQCAEQIVLRSVSGVKASLSKLVEALMLLIGKSILKDKFMFLHWPCKGFADRTKRVYFENALLLLSATVGTLHATSPLSHSPTYLIQSSFLALCALSKISTLPFSNLKTPLGQTALQIPHPTHDARTIS